MNRPVVLTILVVFAGAVFLSTPFIGMKNISVLSVFQQSAQDVTMQIFWSIRVPRVCLAFLAGAALAVSGMAFQAMFINPLATPFTLGVSSGASLGAALYVWIGASFSVLGIPGISLFAFTGAGLSILLVYGLTKIKGGFSTATMLLAGVAINFFFSSLILMVQYLCDFTESFMILRWLMGGLETVGFESVVSTLPFVVIGIFIVFTQVHGLNLLCLGEELATSRGLSVDYVKCLLFFASSLMVGGVVAVCGPIGFVGMMIPHICRLIIGSDHRYLLPATVLFGGSFLCLCDMIARTVIGPAEIPVGVITAVLGGPFFLWLLLTWSSDRAFSGN